MRYCAHPRCSVLVQRGRCPQHQQQSRASRHQRGYDHDWVTLREQFLEQSYPWFCAISGPTCTAKNRMMTKDEIEVDHRTPFRGKADPVRLEITNLRCVCRSCHRERTRGVGK